MSNTNSLREAVIRVLKTPTHRMATQTEDYHPVGTAENIMRLVAQHTQEAVERERSLAMQYLHDTNRLNDYKKKLALTQTKEDK